MSQDMVNKFWSAPPVSRTLVTAVFLESALVHGGLLNPYLILFAPSLLLKIWPEPWRLVTAFLLTSGGFSFVIDLYFLWTYSTGLEQTSPRFTKPGDFFTYVVFVASTILGVGGFLLGAHTFLQPLLLAFIYTFAQDNRGKKAHFIIFQIPVELLPWATLTLTLVLGGPTAAFQQGSGVLAAHAYDFLTRLYPTFQGGRNYIQTPTFVKRWFGADRARSDRKAYGTSYRPGQNIPQQPQGGGGWTSGFSSGSWGGRGSGRRLGGD